MKYLFIILAVIGFCHAGWASPADTSALNVLYERTVDFAEDKLDSILINASFIEKAGQKEHLEQTPVMVQRLRGLYYDLTGDYNEALKYFLNTLQMAREKKLLRFELSALADLAILYSQIKAPEKALSVYRECLVLTEKHGSIPDLISCYGNIGAIYNDLGLPDSALHYLSIGHGLCERYKNYDHIKVIYNNTGNVYYRKKAFGKALVYFFRNRSMHLDTANRAHLWLDELNIGDSYIQLASYDSARRYASHALEISQQLRSKSKEADSYALLSRLEERVGNYRKAFEYLQLWYERDTSLVNQASNRTIAELQERFHVAERDRQTRELMADVESQKTRNEFLTYLAIATVIIGVLIGITLMAYRSANRMLKETNRVISRQKEKLVELNEEKNALISIVSHDLAAPFSSIRMWAQLMEKDPEGCQAIGLQHIRESAIQGEKLIQHILEVEKMTLGQRQLMLEDIDMPVFLQSIVHAFQPVASAKQIELRFQCVGGKLHLMNDRSMLRQIIENLLSNAIKFSPPGREVWLRLQRDADTLAISVQDQGPGISAEDQQRLFRRYTQGFATPTAGESSNGLGLFIVKRLVQELNGQLSVQSAEGAGASFTVSFPID